MQILRPSCCAGLLVFGFAMIVPPAMAAGDGDRSGEQIYRQMCASCHGAQGEGTPEGFPRPLAGDKSVSQLTRFIAKTMPEDDPGTCTGEDAQKVAAYIYDAFYSKIAQARIKPARIELARLTVRQYRNAVADLLGSFRTAGRWDDERGLRGEYFKSRRFFRNGERLIDRRDAQVQFDFKDASPDPETFDPKEFAIRWQGALLAPETGEYELIVKTENAARFWFNDMVRPLIDAGVKSGNDTEYRETVHLLGGRVYPLRLEYYKTKEKTASVALWWKLPRRVPEVIAGRFLSPNRFPETFVVEAAFPPDDRSVGYEKGTSISKAWDQAATEAAIEVAGYVSGHLQELAGVGTSAPDRAERLRAFCRKFAERAFRRPLSSEEEQVFINRQFEEASDPDVALKRVVLLVLKSPRFVYREVGGHNDGYDTAARLAFALWDSLPDAELLRAAGAGELADPSQVRRQAERMAGDLRTRSKLREFFQQWLRVEDVPELAKDPEKFPGFDATIAADLRMSLDLFLDDVLTSKAADFRELLLGDYVYLNGRLARFYGADLPADAPFQRVKLNPHERAGLISHPYLLATFAYTGASSPIHRGVFLARSLLGRTLRPPPEAVAPLSPDLHPSLTTRERVALQTNAVACQTCHNMINPLGFTLEHFDATGRFRAEEKGKPVDASGSYQARSGDAVSFHGARDLGVFLSESDEAHNAFVEQLFHYMVKQPIRAFGSQKNAELRESFARNDFNIRKLVIAIAAASAQVEPAARP